MTCQFCGGKTVERRKMVHTTKRGSRSQPKIAQPKRHLICVDCKRVSRRENP